jgi:hypothetical protein
MTIVGVMNKERIAANINCDISKLSNRYVNSIFFGISLVSIKKIRYLHNLLNLVETDCNYAISKELKKVFSKYDY